MRTPDSPSLSQISPLATLALLCPGTSSKMDQTGQSACGGKEQLPISLCPVETVGGQSWGWGGVCVKAAALQLV